MNERILLKLFSGKSVLMLAKATLAKGISLSGLLLAFCFLLGTGTAMAQTQIATTGITGNGAGAGSPGTGITFNVVNTNGGAIILTDVGYSPGSANPTQLWYSTTSLTGTASIATPTWTMLATVNPTTVANTVINHNLFTNLNLTIPGNTTYRFCVVVVPSTARYCSTVPPATTFTSNGVTLDISSSLWGGSNSVGNTGRFYFGSITFIPAGPPCSVPTSLAASNLTSTSATLGWNGVPGSLGYEYDFSSTNTTPPISGFTATTNTSFNVSGLTPSTLYYLHVRNKCAPPQQATSQWVTYQFTTNPPCTKRGILKSDITTSSALLKWNGEPHASQYEYVLKENTSVPSAGNLTPTTDFAATGLSEGTKYYFFVRMLCPGGETSEWALDSFTTRTICRPPTLNVDHIEANRAIVYWDPVPTALQYEYEISKTPTPLGEGTSIEATNFYAYPLNDGQTHYFHVRSKCNDQGFVSKSEWTTTAFSTFPASIANQGNKDFGIAVFPNPVNDLVTISIAGRTVNTAQITIVDLNGRTVHTSELTSNKTNIDLSNLAPGIYMMRYADQDYSEVIKLTKE